MLRFFRCAIGVVWLAVSAGAVMGATAMGATGGHEGEAVISGGTLIPVATVGSVVALTWYLRGKVDELLRRMSDVERRLDNAESRVKGLPCQKTDTHDECRNGNGSKQ